MELHKTRARLGGAPLALATAWAALAFGAPGLSSASGSPSVASLPTHAQPGVKNCGLSKTTVKPKTLTIACADANTLAKGLMWSEWGPSGATAKGTITWNTCVPNCAASKTWHSSKATYTLGQLVHTANYGWLFEKLTVHITGKSTGGMPRTETYPQKPVK